MAGIVNHDSITYTTRSFDRLHTSSLPGADRAISRSLADARESTVAGACELVACKL
jgi:hypothetical protein